MEKIKVKTIIGRLARNALSLSKIFHTLDSQERHAIFLAPLSVTQFLNKMSILAKVNLQKELKITYRWPLKEFPKMKPHSHLHEELNN